MKTAEDTKKLGTFLGVFTPTILTILGVIMFLRLGWLVGHIGLDRIILIVITAHAITLITTLSFSSVATNTHVGVGGAYYIISRSLGVEIGGAVGVPLFLSQAFSVTLYSFGLAEAIKFVLPDIPLQPTAFLIVLIVGGISFAGAKLALKIQLPIMFMIGVSLAGLAIGVLTHYSGSEAFSAPASGEVGFWTGFSIFFPAVTGVMAGLGLSGDLKDPGKSIPLGSISAVLVGFVIYLALPFALISGAETEALRSNSLIWTKIAPYGMWLVIPGLFGAIFSSAIGAMLAAPRTLQALAFDRVVPRGFGKRTGNWRELMPGFIISVMIALGGVMLGDLNAVAPVVAMFFLTVYGIVNLVAALESLSGDPSWRPKIKIPWPVSLLGAFVCAFAMFLINPTAGIIAVIVELAIWLLLSRREGRERWGDARRGLYERLIRWALIELEKRPMSARNWRPHLMVFVSDIENNLDLVRFGWWFCQGRGLVTACQLIVGDLLTEKRDLIKMRKEMHRIIEQENMVVFTEVDVVSEIVDGMVSVSQANGMAGIESNTVLVGWPDEPERLASFLQAMRRLEILHKSFILARFHPKYTFQRKGIQRSIHVWWGGLQRNGDLMLLLAYLLTRNPEWRDAHVQIKSIVSNKLMKAQTESGLKRLIPLIRIEVETSVFIKPEGKTILEVIHEESKLAEVVIFGLATPEKGDELKYAERLEELAGNFPIAFFVKNSSMFVGQLLDLDDREESIDDSDQEADDAGDDVG